jgi:small GTP-binding protein
MIFPLIQYINILTRDGKSLLFRNYGSSDVDRDLLAGFLNTFSDFMKEGSQSDIKSTSTNEFKYYYTIIEEIIIVVCTDLEDDDATINSKITTIRVKFIDKYGEILSNGSWTGNRAMFTEFGRDIDEIILGPIKVSIIGLGGCGKSDLIRLICGKDIDLEYIPTINVDIPPFHGEGLEVSRSIVLWDFAGQSNFRSLWKSLLDSTDMALLVLDSTFININESKKIIRDLLNECHKNILVIGIANNQDMPNRVSPKFIERILSDGIDPPIKVYGMVASNPMYREMILAILRDSINKISNGFKPKYRLKDRTSLRKKPRTIKPYKIKRATEKITKKRKGVPFFPEPYCYNCGSTDIRSPTFIESRRYYHPSTIICRRCGGVVRKDILEVEKKVLVVKKLGTKVCPICSTSLRNIKSVEDKSKILGYLGHLPLYAIKLVCKKCGHEKTWNFQ